MSASSWKLFTDIAAKADFKFTPSFSCPNTSISWLTPANDVTLEHAVQLIKGGYSHALGAVLGRKREIWQRGFTDHRIRDDQDFANHRDYIHRNPVERQIVIDPCEYRYCSAFPGFKLDPEPAAAKAEFSKSA
jgi:hypothetical protein